MLQPSSSKDRASRSAALRQSESMLEGSMPEAASASLPTLGSRHISRPTTLVVHSRLHAVRFRILSTHSPSLTDVPVSLLCVSLLPGHRTCQKAMDCNGSETSDRNQR
jgi:hypothetical protein